MKGNNHLPFKNPILPLKPAGRALHSWESRKQSANQIASVGQRQRQRGHTLPQKQKMEEAGEVSKPTQLSSLLSSHMEELKVEDQHHDQRRVSCRVFSDYKSMAWKNGLGQSVELAVVPASPLSSLVW
jgi:hypothetical protein